MCSEVQVSKPSSIGYSAQQKEGPYNYIRNVNCKILLCRGLNASLMGQILLWSVQFTFHVWWFFFSFFVTQENTFDCCKHPVVALSHCVSALQWWCMRLHTIKDAQCIDGFKRFDVSIFYCDFFNNYINE